MPTVLRGRKVYLDRLKKTDVPLLTAWWNDTEYQATLRRDSIFLVTEDDQEEWNLRPPDNVHNRDFFGFAIRLIEDDGLIGNAGIMNLRWQARSCEIFIGIGEANMRGKGYGADALRILCNYIFYEMNMHRLGLVVHAFNTTAVQMYERVGFTHEGALRDFVYRDGKHHDMLYMSILAPEWRNPFEGN